MARKVIHLVDTTGPQRTPLDEIPADVKQFVEETYELQRKTPGRTRVEYGTFDELKADFKLMVDYAQQRKNGILNVRRSPSKGLPDNVMDVRITANIEANGARNAGNDRRQPATQAK